MKPRVSIAISWHRKISSMIKIYNTGDLCKTSVFLKQILCRISWQLKLYKGHKLQWTCLQRTAPMIRQSSWVKILKRVLLRNSTTRAKCLNSTRTLLTRFRNVWGIKTHNNLWTVTRLTNKLLEVSSRISFNYTKQAAQIMNQILRKTKMKIQHWISSEHKNWWKL